jgi:hypothetical protein
MKQNTVFDQAVNHFPVPSQYVSQNTFQYPGIMFLVSQSLFCSHTRGHAIHTTQSVIFLSDISKTEGRITEALTVHPPFTI